MQTDRPHTAYYTNFLNDIQAPNELAVLRILSPRPRKLPLTASGGCADRSIVVAEVAQLLLGQLIDNSMAWLPIAAAGILLADPPGDLHVFASSSEQTRLLELLQLQAERGRGC
jgi:hypothetical protein